MASKKFSELTSAVVIALGDVFAFVTGGETKKVKVEDLIGTVLTETLATRASLVTDKGKRLKSETVTNYTVTHGVHAVDDKIDLTMGSADILTLVQGANVSIGTNGKGLKLDGIRAHATLICESTGVTDVFTLIGEVTA